MKRKNSEHLFTNKMLVAMLVPLILEQILGSLMGTIDTMMVSNIGSSAISAVSLVDSMNVLVILLLGAMATGGSIVCSQYIGSKDIEKATVAAKQIFIVTLTVSTSVMLLCLVFRANLLKIVFGKVEASVMENSLVYFFITCFSFPFLSIYNSGSAVFRAQGNTKLPLIVSIISNVVNIIGNWFLIWPMHMGVKGAAIATLFSRIVLAAAMLVFLRNEKWDITIKNYHKIRPDFTLIKKVLYIGIPSGIENSMFQFGKLAIQSTVSTLGTVAIAAMAMTNVLENLSGIAALAVGTGMMTVVGQCVGAGREDEARYFMKKMTVIGYAVLIVNLAIITAAAFPVTKLGGMEPEAAKLCIQMTLFIAVLKPIVWPLSFLPGNGMRAAGDVRFSMILCTLSMWFCRVFMCVILCRFMDVGPIGVWIAQCTDWFVRSIGFGIRWKSGKWLKHKII